MKDKYIISIAAAAVVLLGAISYLYKSSSTKPNPKPNYISADPIEYKKLREKIIPSGSNISNDNNDYINGELIDDSMSNKKETSLSSVEKEGAEVALGGKSRRRHKKSRKRKTRRYK